MRGTRDSESGKPDKSLWQCFLTVWPAGHLHQIHLGEFVPRQIPGPRRVMQGLGSGASESAFGRPQVTLACIKV